MAFMPRTTISEFCGGSSMTSSHRDSVKYWRSELEMTQWPSCPGLPSPSSCGGSSMTSSHRDSVKYWRSELEMTQWPSCPELPSQSSVLTPV